MRRPRAFTLLELLLATALTAVVMIAVLAVVGDLGAPGAAEGVAPQRTAGGRETVEAPPEPGTLEAWMQLLREDLHNAGAVDTSRKNELALTGFAALAGPSRRRTHRPVRVLYRIEVIDGRHWLVRRQEALDLRSTENVERDLVCCGLRRFEVTKLVVKVDRGDAPAARSAGTASRPKSGGAAGALARTRRAPPPDFAYVNHQSFVLDKTGLHQRVPAAERVLIKDRWYVSEDAVAREARNGQMLGRSALDAEDAEALFGGSREQGVTVWRLRAWTGDRPEPAHDRVVTVQSGGSA